MKYFCHNKVELLDKNIFRRQISSGFFSSNHTRWIVGLVFLLFFVSQTFAQGLGPKVQQQLRSLMAEKESRTPTQMKLNSQILYALKMNAGLSITSEVNTLNVNVPKNANGQIKTNIRAVVTPQLLDLLKARNCQIIDASVKYGMVTAMIPLAQIESIAAIQEIRAIDPWIEPVTNGGFGKDVINSERNDGHLLPHNINDPMPWREKAKFEQSRNLTKIKSSIRHALDFEMIGAVTSQGDVTHEANLARANFGVDGSGVKIGVLSDSYDQAPAGINAADDILTGDLPGPGNPFGYTTPVQVLSDWNAANATDEGRAMLQIIHDLAPGAQLYFATAFTSQAGFAQAILDLRSAGCDIIVDDVSYLGEAVFQDDNVAQAVNSVVADGALYFSSAGNSGNLNDGTSGVWEGDFQDGGTIPLVTGGTVHNFGAQLYNSIAVDMVDASIFLKWSDAYGTSGNDYDLFVTNSAGTSIVAMSTNIQNGDDSPSESIRGNRTAGERIYILKKSGAAARALHLNTNRGRLSNGTAGQVFGHNAGANTITVAATPASSVVPLGTSPGPYPSSFNAGNKVELFSSDGPRRIFYHPDGSPISPGNFLFGTSGGTLLQKPDITAADGTSTTFFGDPFGGNFYFFGTSAAAPHAAAIAGLIKSIEPALGAQQIRDLLYNSAIDIEGPGIDRDAGRGIIMAKSAIELLGLSLSSTNVTESLHPNNNGNGFLDPGENGWVQINLENKSNIPITNIVGELQSMTPGVEILIGNVNFPNAPAQGTTSNAGNKFVFVLDKTKVPCGGQIDFVLTTNFNGVLSPQKFTLSGRTGRIQQSLSATWPNGVASGPDFVSGAGLHFGLSSSENYSPACGVPVPPLTHLYPLTLFPFQAYTFANSSSSDQCITLKMSSTDFSLTVYNEYGLNVFNPTANQLANNYFGTPQNNTKPFTVNVPAGKNFSVVVQPDNAFVADGTPYTLDVGLAYCGEYECPEAFPITISPDFNQTFNGTVGIPFTQSFSAQGAQYVFSYSSTPAMPANGLELSGNGYTATLSGIPSTATNGLVPFFIRAEDAHGCEADGLNLYYLEIDPCFFNTIYVSLDSFGTASVSAAEIYPGDINSSFIASTEVIPSTFTCANIGSNSVVLKITDVNGNISECSGTVIVEDNLGPKIFGPPDVTINAEPGVCGATVGDPNIDYIYGGTDNCNNFIQAYLISGLENGSFFPVGTTVCTYQATDPSGNVASYVRTVTVTAADSDSDGIADCADLCPNTFDAALDFDRAGNVPGLADHINVATLPVLNNLVNGDFSFAVWIKPTDDSFATILSKGDGGNANTAFIFNRWEGSDSIHPGTLGLYLGDGSNAQWTYSTTTVPLNTWSHVAVAYNSTLKQASFYLNGELDGQSTYTELTGPLYNQDANSLYIGRQGSSCNCNFFNGQMDELSIWSKLLTVNDIATFIAAAMTGSESNLVAYYNFDDGPVCVNNQIETLNDVTMNNLDGELVNFALASSCTSNWSSGSNRVKNCSSCLDLLEITSATGVLDSIYTARNQITIKPGAQFLAGKNITLDAPTVLFEMDNTVPATTILTIKQDGCPD